MATHYATVVRETVGSTQDEARKAAQVAGTPTLVVARRQVQGRGRSGRRWLEAPRAMYSSLAFRSAWSPEVRSRLTLVAGLCVRRALTDLSGTAAGLKWPNDLVTPDGKLGGILTEAESDWVVIGCGVNLWWPGAPGGIAAACEEDPGPELAAAIGEHWAGRLLEIAGGDPDRWGAAEYRAACVTLGQEITWQPAGTGIAVDIDPGGGLVVDTPTGRRILSSGEVRAVRTAHEPRRGRG